jgi:class 3 adenylate cyclase
MVEHLATMLARLAKCHGGTLEPVSAAGALVTFANPRDSLRLALGLQRGDPRLRLQIGLASGPAVTATFSAFGNEHRVVFGEVVVLAEAAAASAGSGVIAVSGAAYAVMAAGPATQVWSGGSNPSVSLSLRSARNSRQSDCVLLRSVSSGCTDDVGRKSANGTL